jgi:hypothetical protein
MSGEREDGSKEKGRMRTNPTMVRSSDCFERAEFLQKTPWVVSLGYVDKASS